ncbi:hypothetical protein BC831DRAFT_472997 [Entophlyctis helioformis]|nr:hypothetical protein BC831DRAFT_472997 [Entophlyctis helioformis]
MATRSRKRKAEDDAVMAFVREVIAIPEEPAPRRPAQQQRQQPAGAVGARRAVVKGNHEQRLDAANGLSAAGNAGNAGAKTAHPNEHMYRNLDTLVGLLPDADPDFLLEQLQKLGPNQGDEAVSAVLDIVVDLGDSVPSIQDLIGLWDQQDMDSDGEGLMPEGSARAGPSSAAGGQASASATTEMECGCCFGDVSWDNMTQCEDGHLFCFDCARRTIETGMGLQRVDIKCPDTSGCEFGFPNTELKRFLPPVTLEGFLRMRQQVEIRQAEIDGFERCPFCDYGLAFDQGPDEEPLFRCQNDTCGIVTCRKCKKKSHLPDTCAESEKNNAAHLLAEAMTTALLRECPKCKNKFMKEEGCNKMVCTCGQVMCYVCRKPISGYDHFANQPTAGKCPLWDDSVKRNKEDVERAKTAALKDIKQGNEFSVDLDEVARLVSAGPAAKARIVAQPPPVPPAPVYQQARRGRGRKGRPRGNRRNAPLAPPPQPQPPAPGTSAIQPAIPAVPAPRQPVHQPVQHHPVFALPNMQQPMLLPRMLPPLQHIQPLLGGPILPLLAPNVSLPPLLHLLPAQAHAQMQPPQQIAQQLHNLRQTQQRQQYQQQQRALLPVALPVDHLQILQQLQQLQQQIGHNEQLLNQRPIHDQRQALQQQHQPLPAQQPGAAAPAQMTQKTKRRRG